MNLLGSRGGGPWDWGLTIRPWRDRAVQPEPAYPEGWKKSTDHRKAPAVFVDYAHTDDALRQMLATLKPLTKGRLICVFGAGGDRDHGKRPLMGRAVGLRELTWLF